METPDLTCICFHTAWSNYNKGWSLRILRLYTVIIPDNQNTESAMIDNSVWDIGSM